MGAVEGLGRAEDIAAGRGGVARCSLSSGGKGGEQRRGALHCALTWPHQSGQARPVQLPLLGSTHSAPYRVSALSSHLPSPSSPRSQVWEMSMCRSLGCMRGVFVACTLQVFLLPEVVAQLGSDCILRKTIHMLKGRLTTRLLQVFFCCCVSWLR